eukprot:TRINITY_DN12593_c0_g1_i2.p1 TRINITY_DN12593_c0_g1~~TRINITY_DN12593_c0_g1_i2.p1  ORF type:complete len:491 (+),score=55.07 TRINITY_DN12593_c0_g1_i2:242-1714(+)
MEQQSNGTSKQQQPASAAYTVPSIKKKIAPNYTLITFATRLRHTMEDFAGYIFVPTGQDVDLLPLDEFVSPAAAARFAELGIGEIVGLPSKVLKLRSVIDDCSRDCGAGTMVQCVAPLGRNLIRDVPSGPVLCKTHNHNSAAAERLVTKYGFEVPMTTAACSPADCADFSLKGPLLSVREPAFVFTGLPLRPEALQYLPALDVMVGVVAEMEMTVDTIWHSKYGTMSVPAVIEMGIMARDDWLPIKEGKYVSVGKLARAASRSPTAFEVTAPFHSYYGCGGAHGFLSFTKSALRWLQKQRLWWDDCGDDVETVEPYEEDPELSARVAIWCLTLKGAAEGNANRALGVFGHAWHCVLEDLQRKPVNVRRIEPAVSARTKKQTTEDRWRKRGNEWTSPLELPVPSTSDIPAYLATLGITVPKPVAGETVPFVRVAGGRLTFTKSPKELFPAQFLLFCACLRKATGLTTVPEAGVSEPGGIPCTADHEALDDF